MRQFVTWNMGSYYRVLLVVTVFLILLTNSEDHKEDDVNELKTQNGEISESRLLNKVKRSHPNKKGKNNKAKEPNMVKKSKNQSFKNKKKSRKIKNRKTKFKMNEKYGGKQAGKNKRNRQRKKKKKGAKKKKTKDKKATGKEKSSKGPTGRANAENEIFEGPYGFEHPEAIDWTLPQYRCPDCEDTLIIYDPWYAPPPQLHIPVFCSSNLSEFSNSNSFSNFGPNITFIFIPGTLNCSDPAKARGRNNKQFSIEIEQKDAEEETAVETQQEESSFYDCGKSVTQDMSYMSCGEEQPVYSTDDTSRKCFWHFHAYEGWRRQLKFPRWSLPSCPDNSSKGDCCKAGPHLLISKTGYAKKFEAYCGPEAPKFDKSDFDKGKARWLVVFNNTGSRDNFTPQVAIEAPTIGYRKSAAYDQLYYGERCLCGLRNKGKHPAQDPELGQERRIGGKTGRKGKFGKNKKKKNSKGKFKLKNANRKKDRLKKNKNGLKKRTKQKGGGKHNEKKKSVEKREIKKKGKRFKKKHLKEKNKNIKNKKSLSKNKKKGKKSHRKVAAADVGPQDRIRQVWPWMASITYSDLFTCTGFIISPLLVITTTKCFPDLETTRGNDTEAVAALNDKKDLIVVVGQDEEGIGRVDPDHYWEEERRVAEIVIHPDCDPGTSPQFCVLALILTQNFSVNKQQRPRPTCLNCQVNSYQSRVLKGTPYLASYGLQLSQQNAKAGSYKAPTFIKKYFDPSCITRNISTSETYCLKVLGERYMCDVGRVSIGGGTQPGKRDYGGLLINRVGRNGYKINFQVVGLLWNFNCQSSGPAEYIPTWPSVPWMVNLMMTRDKPCIKLIRKSAWTKNSKTDGYYENGNII